MHDVHPEIERFARYCHAQGIDVYELAQQYAQDNPLSYGDYLMASGWNCMAVIDQALQWGWDISEHPHIVLKIAYEIFDNDGEIGVSYETLDNAIEEAFESASPEIKALALGGILKRIDDDEDDEE